MYAPSKTQIDTSYYTQTVELHELFAARYVTRRYLHPEGVAGLGTTLLQADWGRIHPGRCSSVRQAFAVHRVISKARIQRILTHLGGPSDCLIQLL